MNLRKKEHNINYAYLLTLAMLLWGGGWTALKILTYNLPMDTIIFWRFFIMALAFLPVLYLLKKPLKIDFHSLKYILSSTILNIAFMVSSFLGIKYGLAGAGSVIITSLSPLMTFLLMVLLFRKKVSKMQYIGLFLGILGGSIILQLNDLSLFLNGSNSYFLLCAILWAGVTILAQHAHQHLHPIHYSFYISVLATVVAFFYAFDADLGAVFTQNVHFWIALLYLAILGQTLATTIFFMASGKLGSEKTSSFMFLVPIFALLSAWIFLDEALQLHIIVGGVLSMLAVYFINKTNLSRHHE